jgi:hypothetical protein
MDKQILADLDNAVTRSKEITKIVGKLQSAFYTNDEQKIEDYLELTRIYSQYAIDELDMVVNALNDEIATLYNNVIKFPERS